MNCEQAEALIAAHADGELDALRSHAIGKHLRDCAHCAAMHDELVALREALRRALPYYGVPAGLRERMLAATASAAARDADVGEHRALRETIERWLARVPARARWIGGGALGGCVVTLLAVLIGVTAFDWRESHQLVAEAVVAHVRATLGAHQIDVATSDTHTVKPWLSARLDYSPPVRDLAQDGFPLVGGRIDRLDGQPIAVLVYHYRKHVVDVFVRPEASPAPALTTLRGFNVAHARGDGFDWLAVSDASADVLESFARMLASGGEVSDAAKR